MNRNIKTLSLVLLLSTVALVTVVSQADAPKPATPATTKAAEVKHSDLNKPIESLKVGVVSATEIMIDTDLGKDASKKVDTKRQEYMKIAQVNAQDIDKKEKELVAKAPTMSAESQRKQSMEVANLKQDFDLNQKKWTAELQEIAQGEMEKLGKDFDQAVQQIAQESNIDMMFEKESGRIVYANPKFDMTKHVKVSMNNNYKATQTAAAKKDKATAGA
jgi:Skp family chaperone for outer membrane proteins